MERTPPSSSGAFSPATRETTHSTRPGAKVSNSHTAAFPVHQGVRSETGYHNATESSTANGQLTGGTARPGTHGAPPPPLTSSMSAVSEVDEPAAAPSGPTPVVRSGMYPASRRRAVPANAYKGTRLPEAEGSAFTAGPGGSSPTHPAPRGSSALIGSENGMAASPFLLRASAASSTSATAQRVHTQQRQVRSYQDSYTGDAGPQQFQQYAPPSQHGGDDNDGFYYEDEMGGNRQQQHHQQQRAQRNPAKMSSSGSGHGAQNYVDYPSPEECATSDVDGADVDVSNTAAYYQQYCQQYSQYQLYCQQQQQQQQQAADAFTSATSAASGGSGHRGDVGTSYGYAQVPAGTEGYPESDSGRMGGVATQYGSSSSPATPSYGAGYGKRGGTRGRSYYGDRNEDNTNAGDSLSYVLRGSLRTNRGGGPYRAVDKAATGTGVEGQPHMRTASRTDSFNGSAHASSTDALVGYAGGRGPHSTSSGGYPSPQQNQSVYPAEYDSAAAQQYCNSYGGQAMPGGYGDYYNNNPAGGYGYNTGYYGGASQQRQQPHYQRGNGGSRGPYGPSSHASYGYEAQYQDQFGGYGVASGMSANVQHDQQQQLQLQEQQQHYAQQESYRSGKESQQGNAFPQLKSSRQPGGTSQKEVGLQDRCLRSTTDLEESSSAARSKPPILATPAKSGVSSTAAAAATSAAAAAAGVPGNASAGVGESKSAIRKRKKAAAAAAAASAQEAARASAASQPGTQSNATLSPKAAGKDLADTVEVSVGVAAKGSPESAGSTPQATRAGDALSRRSSAPLEARSAMPHSFVPLEQTSSTKKHASLVRPPQYGASTGIKEEGSGLRNAGGQGEYGAALAANAGEAHVTSAGRALIAAKNLTAEMATPTSNGSNALLGDSGTSSSGDLYPTNTASGGGHGRSASHPLGNSPSATQRFLRHSPLTQCVGPPFHTYLNGAIVGQAAQIQSLPPSAASAAAAAVSGGGEGGSGDNAGLGFSTASLSASSSPALPTFYGPMQRLLTRETQPGRAAIATAEDVAEEAAPQRGSESQSVEENAGDAGEVEDVHPGGPITARTAIATNALKSEIRVQSTAGPEQRAGFGLRMQQRSDAGALSKELLASAAEASAGRRPETSPYLGPATMSTPSSSPRSLAGIRPHHMHHFAHHNQHQRADSPQVSGLPQHLHAYRHISPSLQPVSMAAVSNAASDLHVQSPCSVASLPPRSPAGAGASVSAGSSGVSPPLRGRGAGPAIKQSSLSAHITSTSCAPTAPMAGASGLGAASTMHNSQQPSYQRGSPDSSSRRTNSTSGGFLEASEGGTADVYGGGFDDRSEAHEGGNGEGLQSGGPVSPSARAATAQQQLFGESGSGRQGNSGGYRTTSSPFLGFSAPPVVSATPVGGLKASQTGAGRPVPPVGGTATPIAEHPLSTAPQGPNGTATGAAGRNTPSPRGGSQHGNSSSGPGAGGGSMAGGSGSVHANSPQHNRYSPRHQYGGNATSSNSNNNNSSGSAQPNGGFPVVSQRPAYIYEQHIGQDVLLEEFHSAMGFNAPSFGNIACLVDALAPQVPIVSDLEFPCDEEQCQLVRAPGLVGVGINAEEPELRSTGVAPGHSSSRGSGVGSRDGGPSLHLEDTAPPSLMGPPPRPAEADRSHYWDFDGPSYCEPVITLKSIWQSFDSPFGCVVNLAEPIYPAPMRPAEEELVYTPLLSGFRIRFHPASPAYKRLAAIRHVRRQRRREESGAAVGGDVGGGGSSGDVAGSLAEEDGVLTWSAADRPNNRNIILEQITELARGDECYAELLTATSADVDHQSWVALMWQPVFCGGHSAKHSCGTFLAFYLLRAPRHLFVPFANKSEGAAMNSSWGSPVFRGDRAALSFDLWSLQRHYHVARWVSSPPLTHITTTPSIVGEEDDNASSVSASRGRLSWEDGPVGYTSNAAESYSMSNNDDSRARPREVASQSFVEGGLDATTTPHVRLPLVGLIPNRCRSEVWFKAMYDSHGALNAHHHSNNGGGGETFFYHAPLFLMVSALQLMCWDAYNEWKHKPAVAPHAASKREAQAKAFREDTSAAAKDEKSILQPTTRAGVNASGVDCGDEYGTDLTQLGNPLTQLMEENISAVARQQQQLGAGAERGSRATYSDPSACHCEVEGEERDGNFNNTRSDSVPWVAYFAEGVEVMTDAARRYRALREVANLDAALEEGGFGAAAAAASAAAPVAAAIRPGSEVTSPLSPGTASSAEGKKAVKEETIRSGGGALVAGGTSSALCDADARVIAGLLDYYQWAQYDTALSGLARAYCAT